MSRVTSAQPLIQVRVQHNDFSVAEQEHLVSSAGHSVGATVVFTGRVRDVNEADAVSGLFLEHYPGMTESTIETIARDAAVRWQLLAVSVVHRVGQLRPGDRIVCVGVAGAHRGGAFAACEYIMDFLKTQAPFWKKETTPEGNRWVDARTSDHDAAGRWSR